MTAAESRDAAGTEAEGARLANSLEPGALVLVRGEMGAGKTTFVRGACRALGVDEPVVSPTFTIGRRYRGRDGLLISHIDLYRLDQGLGAEDPGLLDDYLGPGTITFVEWPALGAAELPSPAAIVEIRHEGGDLRTIAVEPAG